MDTRTITPKVNLETIEARKQSASAIRHIYYTRLVRLIAEIFKKHGVPPAKSRDAAKVLVAADCMGIESHGVRRLGVYLSGLESGRIRPGATVDVVSESPSMAALDANNGLGQPASMQAMRMAIKKAKETGIGIVTVRNSNHFGVGGYYSLMAAKAGLLGLCLTNSEAMVVPTFGKRPMMGTNPIAVSMPAQPVYFHFDIATSVVPAGKIEVFAEKNMPLPEGWSVGSDGAPNTDPHAFLEIRKTKSDGGLLPLGGFGTMNGGHKGYALSMMVEIMTGVLSGGVTSNHVRETPDADRCSHTFQAIDYGRFGDRKEIEHRLSHYLDEIRESAKADGYDRIYTQGETEFASLRRIPAEGVPVRESTCDRIAAICNSCGINPEGYLYEMPPACPV